MILHAMDNRYGHVSTPCNYSRFKTVDPWRLPFGTRELVGYVAKGLEIPKEWTAHTFALHGRLMILALARIAKLTQRKAAPYVAAKALGIFKGQLEEVISRASSRMPGIRKPSDSTTHLLVPQHEALWMQAIDDVFKNAGLKVQIDLVPPIQSVMAQGYSKTAFLLAQPGNAEVNQRIAREAQDAAQKITRINQTTRDQFERVIHGSISDGLTVPELSQKLRDHITPIAHNRSLTIARTELNNAWTRGSAQSFKESKTLATMDVIGCEAEEATGPQYHGRSTCNYPDLPVTELDAFLAVGFHVNHTGTLIPGSFKK